MTTLTPSALAELAFRELRKRERLYGRLVAERKMTQSMSDFEIAGMKMIEKICARNRLSVTQTATTDNTRSAEQGE